RTASPTAGATCPRIAMMRSPASRRRAARLAPEPALCERAKRQNRSATHRICLLAPSSVPCWMASMRLSTALVETASAASVIENSPGKRRLPVACSRDLMAGAALPARPGLLRPGQPGSVQTAVACPVARRVGEHAEVPRRSDLRLRSYPQHGLALPARL